MDSLLLSTKILSCGEAGAAAQQTNKPPSGTSINENERKIYFFWLTDKKGKKQQK